MEEFREDLEAPKTAWNYVYAFVERTYASPEYDILRTDSVFDLRDH